VLLGENMRIRIYEDEHQENIGKFFTQVVLYHPPQVGDVIYYYGKDKSWYELSVTTVCFVVNQDEKYCVSGCQIRELNEGEVENYIGDYKK
jgi:hypothetical protein